MPSLLLELLLILGVGMTLLELRHRLRPSSPLRLKALDYKVKQSKSALDIELWLEISNPHPRMEVMVPELKIEPVLLGKDDLSQLNVSTKITPHHPDESAEPCSQSENSRKDGYWTAYIVKGHKSTRVQVTVQLQSNESIDIQTTTDSIWVDVHWVNYGPFGRLKCRQGVLVPMRRPEPLIASQVSFHSGDGCEVLPIKTHLLGTLDNTVDVLSHYAKAHLRPGDVLTIGETPVAVMQGRYLHPSTVVPGWLARLLCRAFHPTSSLATACGLQTLIDLVGPTRVLIAWTAGLALKVVGINGGFYRLAGEQARLIDDITGTTPPYDQTIVLGPLNPTKICEQAAAELGVSVAIVDVNDLGRVKVLASSHGCDEALLKRALRPNPAGNANERTPLVLVRPN